MPEITEAAEAQDHLKLKEDEQLDDLQNGFFIIQGRKNFRYGMDAVLLADFARAGTDEKVLDLGTGTGIVPVLLAARGKGAHITGLEIQERSADMAERSVAYNHLEEKINIVRGDMREAASIFGAASFDVVTCNPPYMIGGHGLTNPDPALAAARHEICGTFRDFAAVTEKLLVPHGRFYLIHRPFRLADIMDTLREFHLEPKRMRLVYPFIDREPNLVLLEACRGGNARLTVEKPLIVYREAGIFTDEIRAIYGDGR